MKITSKVTTTADKVQFQSTIMGRNFEYKSEKVILSLFNAPVHPHLEYCIQSWSPYNKKDIYKLE